MIHCCSTEIFNQLTEDAFTEEEQDEYLLLVFLGIITTSNLSTSYDQRIREILGNALTIGFGATLGQLETGSAEFALLSSFEDNIAKFTAAKQYQQVREMAEFLGLPLEGFKQGAAVTFNKYNKQWLQTEFETVVNASKSGKKWIGFEKNKEAKPMLTYHTQRDDRVRPEHALLEGITKNINDPFWDSYTPPNGWNCRCFLTSSKNKAATHNRDIDLTGIAKEIPKEFKFNPAKTGLLFSNAHPYYDVKRGDSKLKKRNFNISV